MAAASQMFKICLSNEKLLRSKDLVLIFIAKLFRLFKDFFYFSIVAQLKLRVCKPHLGIKMIFIHAKYFFINFSCAIPSGLSFQTHSVIESNYDL